MNDGTRDNSTDYWSSFSADAARTSGMFLYARLSQGVGGDAELKELARPVRKGQPMANLLFGAVHYLLLRGAEHPLRRFYKTCGGTANVQDDDLFPTFRDFVLSHRDALAP